MRAFFADMANRKIDLKPMSGVDPFFVTSALLYLLSVNDGS
jgi:hypothetical protein